MGLFSITLRVAPLTNPKCHSESIQALVDTGDTYPVVPENLLTSVGIKKHGKMSISLADGKKENRDYGYAFLLFEDKCVPNIVLFGRPTDLSILGVTVLEQAGFSADPVHQKLVPIAPIQA